MRPAALFALLVVVGCDRPSGTSDASSRAPTSTAAVSAKLLVSASPAATGTHVPAPKEIEIRACAPLEEGEIRLLDVHPHTAARVIATARRTAVVVAGMPTTGCRERCTNVSLKGSAEVDLATVGFSVANLDGVLLASNEPPKPRPLMGGGQNVDMLRERAGLAEVVDLLAAGQRLDHVAGQGLTGEITVAARNVSGRRLLDAVAAIAGGRSHTNGKQLQIEGVRGLPPLDRAEPPNCAAPVCPVVTARCSDTRKMRLVAVARRQSGNYVAPQPEALGDGLTRGDLSAFVADDTGFAWYIRVGDHLGRDEARSGPEGVVTETRRIEGISCGSVTLDDGSTITPDGP